MNFAQIRQFFRDNPRVWGAVAVALVALVAVGWWAWSGSTVQVGQFFAAGCESLANHYCTPANIGCGTNGEIDTTNSCTNTALTCCVANNPTPTPTSPTTVPPTPTPPAPTPGGGATPAPDPTGNCVFRVASNTPAGGAWFCKDLQCSLLGNGGRPPSGPASSLSTKVYREIVLPPDGTDKLHIRTVIDATPKCSGGGECYPPKDPLWTCDGPMYQGRDGSDHYDCYDPIIHRTDYGPITCCANTGLSGDCFTWDYKGGGGGSPAPSPSASVAPLQCAPSTQNVAIGGAARVQAAGGTGVFTWTTNGGGVQDDGGADFAVYSYATAGSKIVTVKSGGLTAFCTVVVGSVAPSPTATVVATPGTGNITAVKQGRNVTLGQTGFFPTISIDSNQVVQFQVQIQNVLTSPASVIIRDALPTGLSYKTGTTMIDGSSAGDGITNSGIPISLTPSRDTIIKWGAVADSTNLLGLGDNLLYPKTDIVTPSGIISADMLVSITGTGEGIVGGTPTPGGVAGVSTGPGDAVVLALIGSAIITLLYTAYTRSPSFRRKEIEHIARGRDPLDFRG